MNINEKALADFGVAGQVGRETWIKTLKAIDPNITEAQIKRRKTAALKAGQQLIDGDFTEEERIELAFKVDRLVLDHLTLVAKAL